MAPRPFQVIEQIVNAVVSVLAAYVFMKNNSASEQIAAYGAAGATLGTLMGAIAGLLFLMFVYMVYRPTLRKQIIADRISKTDSYKDILKILIITISPIILSQTVYHISGVIDNAMFGNIMATKEISYFDSTVFAGSKPGTLYTSENISILLGIYGTDRNLSIPGPWLLPQYHVVKVCCSKNRDVWLYSVKPIAIKFNMLLQSCCYRKGSIDLSDS